MLLSNATVRPGTFSWSEARRSEQRGGMGDINDNLPVQSRRIFDSCG
jgi:hypothetical protein